MIELSYISSLILEASDIDGELLQESMFSMLLLLIYFSDISFGTTIVVLYLGPFANPISIFNGREEQAYDKVPMSSQYFTTSSVLCPFFFTSSMIYLYNLLSPFIKFL